MSYRGVCQMYFSLLFQVISRSYFRFTPAAPTIVHFVSHTCSDWPAITEYLYSALSLDYHSRSQFHTVY